MVQVLWEFEVEQEKRAAFERVYGGEGEWAKLFHGAGGYEGTTLLRDGAEAGQYVTIDRWASSAQYETFKKQHAEEYAALDRQCENLTKTERLIGYFEEI